MNYKLYIQNTKKNINTSIVYMITMTLIVTIMYAFVSLVFNEDMMRLSKHINTLRYSIFGVSVLVVFISIFMVNYTLQITLLYRQKEFGIYTLLGMTKKSICKMFLIENIALAILVMIIGVVLGGFLSQLLTHNILSILDREIGSIETYFSSKTTLVICSFYCVIYAMGVSRAVRKIYKQRIIDLLYENNKNELMYEKESKNIGMRFSLFVLISATGIVLIVKGLLFTSTNAAFIYMLIGVVLSFIGMYKVYNTFPKLYSVGKNENWKYKGSNVFLYGQIKTRINSIGKVLGISGILITCSLITIYMGLSMAKGYKANIDVEYPYDIAIAFDAKIKDFNEIIQYVEKLELVEESVTFYLYENPDYDIDILALSDYNKLRKQCGLKEKQLDDLQYIIHCDSWTMIQTIEGNIRTESNILIEGIKLEGSIDRIYTEPLEQYQIAGHGGYSIIVPDYITEQLETHKSRLTISLKEAGNASTKEQLEAFIHNQWEPQLLETVNENITISIYVKAWGMINSLTGFIILAFTGLYLSVIFIIFSCTLLFFKHTSNVRKNARQYQTIKLLGVSQREINGLIFKETAFTFLVPMALPVMFITIVAVVLNYSIGNFILEKNIFVTCLGMTLLIFGSIYISYFLMTYKFYKKCLYREIQ